MDAQSVKDILSLNDIADLLSELGGDPSTKGSEIYSRTICHGGNKKKLVYYEATKQFHCFTDCSCSYDIFSLVGKVYSMDFPQSFRFITGKFGINIEGGYVAGDRLDNSFIRKFKKREHLFTLNEINKNLLNSFYQLYHQDWIKDGISIETMKKFGTLFSIRENKIIIPHFDVNDRLLGIRGRALNQDEIDAGKKYMPVFHKAEVRKHPTGANIYGVNVTKNNIKKHKTIILFESEKAVLQLDTMLPNLSIGGGISGSSLSFEQVKIIRDLDVDNVVLALDKEFSNEDEELFYKMKIKSGFIDKLLPYFNVSILWDTENLLGLKDSPTDKGLETFEQLWNNRIHIG